jgi:hypothetical protein
MKDIICLMGARMDWDDYLRDEARKYRKLAEEADDPLIKQQLLELANICDKLPIISRIA